MSETQNSKQYDLEDRTYQFATDCRRLIRKLKKHISNAEDSKQLARASGSIAANYIEANESLSKKDFIMRIKICRKEAKESILWLKLIDSEEEAFSKDRAKLVQEGTELMKIFGSIVIKSE